MKYSVPLLVLLMGADVGLTFLGFEIGNCAVLSHCEANPLFTPAEMLAAKLVAVAFILSVFYYARTWKPALWVARGANALMLGVVIWNLWAITAAL